MSDERYGTYDVEIGVADLEGERYAVGLGIHESRERCYGGHGIVLVRQHGERVCCHADRTLVL